MNTYELRCALTGHFTLGPTGKPMRCLRCGVQLDGMGLDPRLSQLDPVRRCDSQDDHKPHTFDDGRSLCVGVRK